MRSIFRDPRRKDHTIWTTVAPDEVFTVRTYGDGDLSDARDHVHHRFRAQQVRRQEPAGDGGQGGS